MLQVGRYVIKRADQPREFAEIHRLNYRTFVEEIPQHAPTGEGVLVDKFHDKSTYFVALLAGRVVGMLSVHDRPPFSVADRLADPAILEGPSRRPMEVRLLAIEPEHRGGLVLGGLLFAALQYARDRYSDVYISGVAERVEMYERLGFRALGPPVKSGTAEFVPMRATLPLDENVEKLARLWRARLARHGNGAAADPAESGRIPDALRICLLPGPVAVASAVRAAFASRPISHRSAEFVARFEHVRKVLGALVGGRDVALLQGSGTLANETIAATLAAEIRGRPRVGSFASGPRGLVLVNGEFGARLVLQAARFGLRPRVLTWNWGEPWDLEKIDAVLEAEPPGSWVWGVHLESSTGVLNDLAGLVRLARKRRVRVCADCVSSLGAVPLDLTGVYLASGTSGKSLGAYAGIAIVIADRRALAPVDLARMPSYFDLAATLETIGPRYTFAWPALAALEQALREYETAESAAARYAEYAKLGAHVRSRLREVGIAPVADDRFAAPVITTFAPPANESSAAFVARSAAAGFDIAGESRYLARRRMVQIATMGAASPADVDAFIRFLARGPSRLSRAAPAGRSPTRSRTG